jgi:hypothetical protein
VIGRFPDMSSLWHGACERILYAPREKLDRWTGLTVCLYDNFLAADSMAFDFDVGRDLWLTKSRFPKLQRDYLEWDELEAFLERCEAIATNAARRGVITQMHCRRATQKETGDAQHAWGNCMMGFTYHGGQKWGQPTLALHSRVSYIAYLGAMDMALAWVIAREIAERTDMDVEDMAFRWYASSLQWHGMKSVPYTIAHGHADRIMDAERYPSRAYPAVCTARRCIASLQDKHEAGVPLTREHNPYGPVRRMRARYHRYMEGPQLPSVPLASLELLPPERRT